MLIRNICFDQLTYIARGAYTIVYAYSDYVVKIGRINPLDVEALHFLHNYALAPKIIDVQYNVQLPAEYSYLKYAHTQYYGYADTLVDIMIMQKVDTSKKISADVAREFAHIVYQLCSYRWLDPWPENMGCLDGKFVIFDV